MKSWVKKLLIISFAFVISGAAAIWYIFNEKFTDTQKRTEAFKVDAKSFLNEFVKNDTVANKKYTEKIVTINGIVSEIETMDTVVNIKMIDTITNAYVIFALQEDEIKKAKQLKEGDSVSIKGSCSGGVYSEILEAESIYFKRCVFNK